jgi:hypothetical protein
MVDAKTNKTAGKTGDTRAALGELRPYAHTPMGTMADEFGLDLWDRWAEIVRTDPRYHLRDPDNPDDVAGATGSAGGSPMPALIVEYGPGQHQYISTVFDAGQVIVQDGGNPNGRAWKFPESAWRRFVAVVRGETDALDDEEEPKGPTMHEAAAAQNARTFARAERERREGVAGATGVDTSKTK